MRNIAQEYINQKIVVIPLSKEGDGKGTNIKDWQKKEFEAERFSEDDNIGINLKLSKKADADWDSKESVYFAPKFMSPTRTLGIKSPTGSMVVNTHYIYDEQPYLETDDCSASVEVTLYGVDDHIDKNDIDWLELIDDTIQVLAKNKLSSV